MPLYQTIVLYMKFQKNSLLEQMGHFTPILHQYQHPAWMFFIFLHFWNFSCRVHILVSRKMKWETWNFQVVFKSFLLYLKFVLSLWPSVYRCCSVQSYFIFYMFIFHDFKSDMMRLCMQWADKSGIYIFSIQRRSLFGMANQIFLKYTDMLLFWA